MSGKPDSSLLCLLLKVSVRFCSRLNPLPRFASPALIHMLPERLKLYRFASFTVSGTLRELSCISSSFKLARPD